MRKVIKLKESDLRKIIKNIINEQSSGYVDLDDENPEDDNVEDMDKNYKISVISEFPCVETVYLNKEPYIQTDKCKIIEIKIKGIVNENPVIVRVNIPFLFNNSSIYTFIKNYPIEVMGLDKNISENFTHALSVIFNDTYTTTVRSDYKNSIKGGIYFFGGDNILPLTNKQLDVLFIKLSNDIKEREEMKLELVDTLRNEKRF
jgi:hypothetical protein